MIYLMPSLILKKFKENRSKGNFKAITMFIDISGFTMMTQELMKNGKEGAEILSEIINDVYTPAIKSVYDHNGFITTFAGDAFTSVFPYKNSKPIFALNAVQHIQKTFNHMGKQKTKFGEFELSVKVGLSYGTVNWGIVKGDKFNSYYFIGNAIDNCAKCEHNAEKCEIIFDEVVLQKIQNKATFEKKSKNHFLLKTILKADKHELQKKSTKQLPQTDFIPEKILKLKSKGEFRDIVSCFISFEECRNWKKSVSKIIELTNIYGGYFNKIDFGDKGGNILVLFGAPVGKDKIYSRACGFAQAVKNISDFNNRIGLTYGTVFAGFVGSKLRAEYTALGMVVNLSARFMMKANYGDIYIDRFINKHIQNRYETKSLSEHKFKGFNIKIPVYLLDKKKIFKSFYEGKLIGRQKELQKLKKSLKPIQNKKFGGIVYVHGIAGIGKSRLVNELKNLVILSGDEESKSRYNWFYLPCDEILRKSFNPFTRFLKDYFQQSNDNTKKINKSNFESKLENIIKKTKDKEIKVELLRTKSILGAMISLSWKNSLYEQLDAKGRFENTLYAVKNLIKAESLQKPVIIELEDGHWIDSDSKKISEVLTRNVDKYPIIIISACRLKDDGAQYNLELKEIPQKNIVIEYLEKESSKKLIEDKLNGIVTDKLFNLIWQKSEGNPFYIEQIILYLQENGLIDNKLVLTKQDIKIPITINSIIVARIDRLTDELKELVQTASVLGREFAVNILSAMLENKSIINELHEGEKENIWNALTDINYIFKHALIRETVYEMQLKKQLRKLHKLAAETIENLHKGDLEEFYGELASHFEKVDIEDKAIEYLEKAGDYAKENYQNDMAIGFYDKLLEKQIDIELRIDIFLKKGAILQLIGKWKESEEIYKNAFKLSKKIEDKNRIGDSASYLGRQFRLKGDYTKAMECFEKSFKISEEIGDKKGISAVVGNIGVVYENQGNYSKAIEYYEKQLTISEELGDKRGISNAVGNMGSIHYLQSDYSKAMECYKKYLTTCEELGDKNGISIAVGNIGSMHYLQGDYSKVMECYKKDLNICEELGDIRGISIAIGNMGSIHYHQNNYPKAMECYEKKLTICEELGDKNGISIAVGNMGNVYKNQGDYAKAMEYYDKKLTICQKLEDKRGIEIAVGNMGLIYSYQGDYPKAMEYYDKKLTICEELGDKGGIEIAIGNMGLIYSNQGDYPKAMECFEKKLTICEELGDKRGISIAVGNMGLIYSNQDDYPKAMEFFEKAIALKIEIDAKSSLTDSLTSKANCLYKMQEYEEARECNEKCYHAANEVESERHIFFSNILKEKINFKLLENHQSKQRCIENLESLLKDEEEKENIALLNYELVNMNYELEKKDMAEKHKEEAIKVYRKLYKKIPKIEYKDKADELEILK